jgi:hypothetical protein
MGHKIARLISVFSVAIIAAFGFGVGHVVSASESMPGMEMGSMQSAQCQSLCLFQLAKTETGTSIHQKKQTPDPLPVEPYYTAFAGVSWVMTVLISAAFLFRYLKWRPPDITALNVLYRF